MNNQFFTKQKLLIIGILLIISIVTGIFWVHSTLPYKASQFILVTSDQYNWPETHIFAMFPDDQNCPRY